MAAPSSTDASMVSTNSLFDATSSASRDHDMFSDPEYEVNLVADKTKTADTKLNTLLQQSERNAQARSDTRPNTPRNPESLTSTRNRPPSITRGRSSTNLQSPARSISKMRSTSGSLKRTLDTNRDSSDKQRKSDNKVEQLQRTMLEMQRQMEEVTKENERNKQEKHEAENAWATEKTIGNFEVTRMQQVVTHVAGKAAEAQAETQAVRQENQSILQEAENAKRTVNIMAEACNQANTKFEGFRQEAIARDHEQTKLREQAELSANQAKEAMEEMSRKKAMMKETMEQMAVEYHSTLAKASEEDHTIDEYKRMVTMYYHQPEDCTNKLVALEITCKNQQDTIARAEQAFNQKHSEYQLLLHQAEDLHKQLVQNQTKLRDEEQKAMRHVSAILDIT